MNRLEIGLIHKALSLTLRGFIEDSGQDFSVSAYHGIVNPKVCNIDTKGEAYDKAVAGMVVLANKPAYRKLAKAFIQALEKFLASGKDQHA